MDVRTIKHAAKLSEWSEHIRACRSSGEPVKTWCEENGINIKSYYRWEERLYMAEATMHMQLLAEQGREMGALMRIEPEKLPLGKNPAVGGDCIGPSGEKGILLRRGGIELELPEGMVISRVVELVKALSGT